VQAPAAALQERQVASDHGFLGSGWNAAQAQPQR